MMSEAPRPTPINAKHTSGGSTGGEGAILAMGGSDVAGSVRCPAHFSGYYSLKCSTGRWMKFGMSTSMSAEDGIPAVYSTPITLGQVRPP